MALETRIPLVEVDCPVCGSRDATVRRAACYPPDIEMAALRAAYSASSDHVLMDQVVECRQCGMVYITPRPDARLIQDGYESGEDRRFVAQNPERIHSFERKVRSILKRTGLNPAGRRLLDVGCAGGAFLVAAGRAGFHAQGLEPSRWLADYSRSQYGLDVRQAVLEPGLFPESSFDVVTIWDVIEHVPEPRAVLAAAHSLLKPGGYLWLSYPDIATWSAKLLGRKWPFWLSVHLHYYRPSSMRQQLERSGFVVKYMQSFDQELKLGYILQRAAGIVPPVKVLGGLVSLLRLRNLPIRYHMGQRMVVAQRVEA